jgi:hypothetical protein
VASEGGDRERSSWGEDRIEERCALRWASPGRLLGRGGGKQEAAREARGLDRQLLACLVTQPRRRHRDLCKITLGFSCKSSNIIILQHFSNLVLKLE